MLLSAMRRGSCHVLLVLQEMTGLECGHQFCCRCWQTYLTFKITEEGVGQVCDY